MKYGVIATLATLALSTWSSVEAQGMKWHPGHYAALNAGESLATHLKRIDSIGDVAGIKGVMVRIYWAEVETSKGVYDFSKIDTYLAQLRKQSTSKRLVLRIMERRFVEDDTGIVPSYLSSESIYRGGLVRTTKGYAARLWEAPVMDRLITLYKVIGQRYDKDNCFEGIATEETTLGLPKPYPLGYSDTALSTQWQRLAW